MEGLIVVQNAVSARLETFVKNYKKCSKANKTKSYLIGRRECLKELWLEFATNHQDLLIEYNAEYKDIQYFKADTYGTSEEKYFDLIGELGEAIEELERQKPTPGGHQTSNSSGKIDSGFKLPRLEIPFFNGSYDTWRSFHDLYVAAVHDDKKIPNVHKLQFLLSRLTGDAAKLLDGFPITSAGYDEAWATLLDRFNNKRVLVNTQLANLFSQPKAIETAEGIRQLRDTTSRCLKALNNLEVTNENWQDVVLVYHITQRLPTNSLALWEQNQRSAEIPTYAELQEFMDQRFRTLEYIATPTISTYNLPKKCEPFRKTQSFHSSQRQQVSSSSAASSSSYKCKICARDFHPVKTCPTFVEMTTEQRMKKVNELKLCKNCFAYSHMAHRCLSSKRCAKCGKKHNTLVHSEIYANDSLPTQAAQIVKTTPATATESSLASQHIVAHIATDTYNSGEVLLATTLINVASHTGKLYTMRALLDQASQATFITEAAVSLLGLTTGKSSVSVSGVGRTEAPAPKGMVHCVIQSRTDPTFSTELQALVMPSLTHAHPSQAIFIEKELIEQLSLADPTYGQPGPIDLILSADVVAKALLDGVHRGSSLSPVAQNSRFGWILFGKVATKHNEEHLICHHTTTLDSIDRTLRAFHEIEDIAHENSTSTQDETACETNYQQTVQRNTDGRYIVSLPFRSHSRPLMGNSRDVAVSRLFQIERRFARDAEYKQRYVVNIEQFIKNGIMRPASSPVNQHSVKQANGDLLYSCSYLPHHGVVKESSTTTKLRTVFDASCKSKNGKSLNDTLLIGATIQDTLITLLLRWRIYPIVIKADIAQMYLQVLINDQDADYQRIVWRSDTNQPIRDYTLNSVTFGTASAPFLAIRTLHQLADDEGHNYPTGARILKNDFYVDDLMSGADTLENAKSAQQQVINILKSGGFQIRKWASNAPEIVDNVKMDEREICKSTVDTIKTLGLNWNPGTDRFQIKTNPIGSIVNSKRTLLSAASKIFDPLGWVAPSVVIAKMLLQRLWLEKGTWDEALPAAIKKDWLTFESNLVALEKISLPRFVGGLQDPAVRYELHAFCDASERAYAAVVYLRSSSPDGKHSVQLLAAKSRVAPVKKITLPRLELCGAVLAAKLAAQIQNVLQINNIHLWSDSQIALAWIRGHPSRWKAFVANRVNEILTTITAAWHYVPSKENPADCASRGLQPSELPSFDLWWNGPTWLRRDTIEWPKIASSGPEIEIEIRNTQSFAAMIDEAELFNRLLNRVSKFNKLLRVTAYCFRWQKLTKREQLEQWISTDEMEVAEKLWIKHIQKTEFAKDIVELKASGEVSQKSSLLRLKPTIDDEGIIRADGRLKNAEDLEYDERNPIMLPKKGRFIEMLIDRAHIETKHGGTTLVATYLRQRFWILDARNAIRFRIRKCVKCFRYSNPALTQLMAALPKPRVSISRPFTHTGIDYAGPLEILTRRGRGRRQITKGYICLFVCLSTKAIHLELASDMTTNTFLAAFHRFASRRGKPLVMHSDNGLNFVGAARQIEREFEETLRENEPEIAEQLANDSVKWKFIPPAAPHFGGLWEAGVKSTKYHLKRTLGDAVLTFEEMSTTLAEIEGCLNSRPLCPLTADPTDLTALTPAHFLVGDIIVAAPRPSVEHRPMNRLDRWQQKQLLTEHFWTRWSTEYLSRLQQRPKWLATKTNLEVGDMVLVRDERLPPSKWMLGRVTQTHCGKDDLVRVATIRTATTHLKRPISKLCRLPIDQ